MAHPAKNLDNGLTRFKKIPIWIFLCIFLISLTIAVLALRQNNKNMIIFRTRLYAADESGVGVNEALNNLREYVYSHMNTNLASGGNAIKPPIQLKNTYERLTAVENEKVKKLNEGVDAAAQKYCEQQLPNVPARSTPRVNCAQDYIVAHLAKANNVPAALYKFDFVSPAWSPDLAGWSLLASMVFLVLLVMSLAADKLVKIKLTKDS